MSLKSYFEYQMLKEMAAPGRGAEKGTHSTHPIQYDKDDILFLKQFDVENYDQALQKRHELLFDALKELQKKRDLIAGVIRKGKEVQIINGGLADNVRKFLMGEDNSLTDDQKERISKRHTFKSGKLAIPLTVGSKAFWNPDKTINQKDVDELAEDDAFEISKDISTQEKYFLDSTDQNTGRPKKIKFEFSKRGSGRPSKNAQPKVVLAFPYLSRLYHKLERTKGEHHLEISGIEGKGEFGYDLSHPEEVTDAEGKVVGKTTRGMNWVGPTVWSTSLKGVAPSDTASSRAGYFAHLAYGHFGNLRELKTYRDAISSDRLAWLPLDGKEHTVKLKDSIGELKPFSIKTFSVKDPQINWLLDEEKRKVKEECEKRKEDPNLYSSKAKNWLNSEVKEICGNVKAIGKEAEKRVKNLVSQGQVYAHEVPGIPQEERRFKIEGEEIQDQYIYLPFYVAKLPAEQGDEPQEKLIPILSKSSTLLRTGTNFTPSSIEIAEDPTALSTKHRTEVINVGVSPNRQSQEFADERVASNYHLIEDLKNKISKTPHIVRYGLLRGQTFENVVPEFMDAISVILNSNIGGASEETKTKLANEVDAQEIHQDIWIVALKNISNKELQTSEGLKRFAKNVFSNLLQTTKYEELPRRKRGRGGDVGGFKDDTPGGTSGEESITSTNIERGSEKRGRGDTLLPRGLARKRGTIEPVQSTEIEPPAIPEPPSLPPEISGEKPAPVPYTRPKMTGGPSPLLRRKEKEENYSLHGLTISERVDYFKNKLKRLF